MKYPKVGWWIGEVTGPAGEGDMDARCRTKPATHEVYYDAVDDADDTVDTHALDAQYYNTSKRARAWSWCVVMEPE